MCTADAAALSRRKRQVFQETKEVVREMKIKEEEIKQLEEENRRMKEEQKEQREKVKATIFNAFHDAILDFKGKGGDDPNSPFHDNIQTLISGLVDDPTNFGLDEEAVNELKDLVAIQEKHKEWMEEQEARMKNHQEAMEKWLNSKSTEDAVVWEQETNGFDEDINLDAPDSDECTGAEVPVGQKAHVQISENDVVDEHLPSPLEQDNEMQWPVNNCSYKWPRDNRRKVL